MPFVKGQSGNPGGQSKQQRNIAELAREYGPAAIRRLAYWMESEDPRASTTAATALLDRGFGKPKQETEVTGKDGAPLMPSLHITMASTLPVTLEAKKVIDVIEEDKGE